MSKKLSTIQQKLLEVLRSTLAGGDTLSLRELAGLTNLDSANAVLYHIRKLEEMCLLVRDNSGKVIRVNSPDEVTGGIALLPLLGNARCGQPLDQVVNDATETMVSIPLGSIGRNLKRKLYLIKAVGKSMEPKIEEEDLVIFEPSHIATSGKIVVARTQEGFVIKQFMETPNQLILKSINPQFNSLVFNKADEGKTFNIDGVAIGIFKPESNLKIGGETA